MSQEEERKILQVTYCRGLLWQRVDPVGLYVSICFVVVVLLCFCCICLFVSVIGTLVK